ncbi:four helix bundle protein [Pseudomonas sp. DG56-2]|uniref:four helix bundle protein n=1 Tax=Pseudomonas sp. DG56-2 TaxID=2320270 RepID=UPI0010A608F6|nr:four helix bundle protein [Pseudomonas sp. DG56-2]
MGMHTSLPIHKVAFDLLNLALDLTRNIPRDFKTLLGAKLRDECLEVMVLIGRANMAADKRPALVALVERVQVIEYLVRVLKEKRFISIPQHASAIALTTSIGKQANAWKRSTPAAPAT